MYTRWAEQHGYKIEFIEETGGEEAGIKSATIQVKGRNAYGWLKTENGVHRLVRISPFDSNARRHTSFASVNVYPVIDDRIKVDIKESDVRTDTLRASGAGGQHVNKTESAIRLTHIPTNIVVYCQNDRSQHRNRAQAWDMLRARIYEMELKKREAQAAADQANKTDIGWGHQIRSYVLQPYQMVKDLRTGVQTSNTGGVLDGDLDPFMEAALAQKAFGTTPGRGRGCGVISKQGNDLASVTLRCSAEGRASKGDGPLSPHSNLQEHCGRAGGRASFEARLRRALRMRRGGHRRKNTSTFIPTASGPGSSRSITTSATLTSVRLRWPRAPMRPGSTNGAMEETLPATSRPRKPAARTTTGCPTLMSP